MFQILDYIYYNNNLAIEDFYTFPPFNIIKSRQYPGNILQYLLLKLKQLMKYKKHKTSISLGYRHQVFNAICAQIQKHIATFSPMDCALSLYRIVELLLNDLNDIETPLAINLLLNQLYAERNQAGTREIAEGLWAIRKLITAGRLTSINAAQITELLDSLLVQHDKMTPMDISSSLWSVTQLILDGKLANFNEAYIHELFKQLREHLAHAKPAEISIVLWSIAKLIEAGMQFPQDIEVESLLYQFLLKQDDAKIPEIANLLWSIAIFVQAGILTKINESQIVSLFDQLYTLIKANAECIAKSLWAIAKLVELKKLTTINIDYIQQLFDRLYAQSFVKTHALANGLWSLAKLLQAGIPINIDAIQIERWVNRFYHQCELATSQEMADSLWAISQLILSRKMASCPAVQELFEYSQRQQHETPQLKLEKDIVDLAKNLKYLTGRDIFLIGSGAANAGLPDKVHSSDYDLRLFDYDEELLFKQLSICPYVTNCKKIDGQYPIIRFNLNVNGKTHLIEIATWQKLIDETDHAAMIRMLNKGFNLESLYVPLTRKQEIRGPEHALASFAKKNISLVNKRFIPDDPIRALRIAMKKMDFPDFEMDYVTKKMIRDANLKECFKTYLKKNSDPAENLFTPAEECFSAYLWRNKRNNPHEGKFSTTMDSWFSRHGLTNVINTMDELDIFDGITDLTYADIKPTLALLQPYDHCDPYTQRRAFYCFLLAHFCAKHVYYYGAKSLGKALSNWKLSGVVGCLSLEHRDCLDYIVYKAQGLTCPVKTAREGDESNQYFLGEFFSMVNNINAHYSTKPRLSQTLNENKVNKGMFNEDQRETFFANKSKLPINNTHCYGRDIDKARFVV